MLEAHLEQALVARISSLADWAAVDLATKRAAFEGRLGQAIAAARHRYRLGLAASDHALQHAENVTADEFRDELSQVIAAQRRAFSEHDAIPAEEASLAAPRAGAALVRSRNTAVRKRIRRASSSRCAFGGLSAGPGTGARYRLARRRCSATTIRRKACQTYCDAPFFGRTLADF